ncbi:protein of unknown function [Acidithiobacillus ferrivorans]|uniref:Uncharacterized protein n=1 Tax=Acidithiobacillus ferrivorans TaxID=160808 RepID=A0A060US73_9PROT|nr:hypothetical protein AFERRI_30284 [Acidithiobacillus ferrivorans]SMH67116.1 protein of unknown function [Acidithiobacillus ferrivorans]
MIQLVPADTGDYCRAGVAATGQSLPGTALPDPQLNMAPVTDFHEPHIAALGKVRVCFNTGTQGGYRCIGHAGYAQHRVGIAHADGGDAQRVVPYGQQVFGRFFLAAERNLSRGELRNAHVDGDFTIILVMQDQPSGQRLDGDWLFVRESGAAHEDGKAAGAVAALRHLSAVRIKDAVPEITIGGRRGLYEQNLIATDAEVAVGYGSDGLGAQLDPLTNAIENDEIVTQALHLGEAQGGGHRISKGVAHVPSLAMSVRGGQSARIGGFGLCFP